MEKRQEIKEMEFNGRQFHIKKFDALTGSYIAYQLMAGILPMGLSDKIGAPKPKNASVMGKQEFMDLQRDCLKVCYEVLPSGETPILDDNGNFAVIGMETDIKTILALTVTALTFNISGFFDESLLASLAGAISDIYPQDVKTLMNSSTHQ
jgi:hypothetical protein